jgi:hypothetical protein
MMTKFILFSCTLSREKNVFFLFFHPFCLKYFIKTLISNDLYTPILLHLKRKQQTCPLEPRIFPLKKVTCGQAFAVKEGGCLMVLSV